MKITSLKQLQEMPVMARVLSSTWTIDEEKEKMIGGDFEVRDIYYEIKLYVLWNKDKKNSYGFSFSDIQILTPVEYKGRLVGVGDEVLYNDSWYEVFGWTIYDTRIVLRVSLGKNYEFNSMLEDNEIQDIRPLYPIQDDEVQKAIELLVKKGKLVDGKILS